MQLGKLQVLAARLLIPWIGPWQADLELDVGSSDPLPTGAQTFVVAGSTLAGTIDVRGTGHIGEKAMARLVAGGNGWGNAVTRKYFGNDASAGVTSKDVLAATVGEIGEMGVDAAPVSYGPAYTRPAGRASQIFDGRDWYVDAAGMTHVASWPSATPTDDVIVLSYDPEIRRAEFASDTLVWPGTTFTDARFETLTARDVEINFTRDGARGVIWHSASSAGRLGAGLEAMVEGLAPSSFLKAYRYRVQKQNTDGRLYLQAVSKAAGMPDTLPVSVWPGIPGVSAVWSGQQLGLLVSVVFLEGDPSLPRVVGFDGRAPTELHFDAATLIKLGANANDFVALAAKTQANFDAINTALTSTGLPVAGGGGGTAKLATPIDFQAVKAAKVEAE